MNQAEKYEYLAGLTGGKVLDSDYRAAFYILSSVPELFEIAREHVNADGISFDRMKELARGNMEQSHELLLSMAHNLFSWNSSTSATPHELSRLGYPWMEIACNAIFISSGQVQVEIQENGNGDPELVLDAAKYERTKEIYEGMQRMGEMMAARAGESSRQEEAER